ncbi:MAG: hypothetical protein CMH21_01105 [Methylophaga sp.]|nr:hypothetical protein [Methylophaga sp.]MAY16325.1 hypothetical protein [Methylophaga sp.]THK42198.1 hypothetical protein E8Q33_05310 [Methylophaga sp. SB9B]
MRMDSKITIKMENLQDEIRDADQARHHKKGRLGFSIYHFSSYKNQRTFSCESSIEKDYALRLEYDRNVTGYMCQPETFNFIILGKKTTYTPDFLVHYADNSSRYVDTKPDVWTDDEEMVDRLHEIKINLNNIGKKLIVVPESKIRQEPLLTNIQMLYQGMHLCSDEAFTVLKNTILQLGNNCTVKDLRAIADGPSELAIRKALFLGNPKHISQEIINEHTIVELPSEYF